MRTPSHCPRGRWRGRKERRDEHLHSEELLNRKVYLIVLKIMSLNLNLTSREKEEN